MKRMKRRWWSVGVVLGLLLLLRAPLGAGPINMTGPTGATGSAGPTGAAGAAGSAGPGAGCNVRLTATSGVPVTTTDVATTTSVYVTPFLGNKCTMSDGTVSTVTEVTVALGTLTSGLPYDVFCYDSSGALACDAPVAWTDDTTRATAVVLSNGRYVKSGATTRLYIGTLRTISTTQTTDSLTQRYVWSCYNPQPRHFRRNESTSNWTYDSATLRQARGSTANQVAAVIGLLERPLFITVQSVHSNSVSSGASVCVGEDSTTACASNGLTGYSEGLLVNPVATHYVGFPATVGYHYFAWLESVGGGTSTFFHAYSGITGWVWG